MNVGEFGNKLNQFTPFDLAESWDNVGLIVGESSRSTERVLVCIDLTVDSVNEAVRRKARTIVCHHPPIFKPVTRITAESSPALWAAFRHGLNVFALHTNFDLAPTGASERIAAGLELRVRQFLSTRSGAANGLGTSIPSSQRLGKFVVYVPEENIDRVRQAVFDAGAGHIGQYSHCSFSVAGEGTFLGHEGTNPAIGKRGQLERVGECRLEVIFPWTLKAAVISAARKAHPYEEMAFDVFEVAHDRQTLGYGFVAEAGSASGIAFPKFCENVKRLFQVESITVVGPGLKKSRPSPMKVRRVAFSPGSGTSFVSSAVAAKADVYLCGEVGYHQMVEAKARGLTLVLLGHSYSERFFIKTVVDQCKEWGVSAVPYFELVHATI